MPPSPVTHAVCAPPRSPAVSGPRVGRFEVTATLGAGGMGVVYLAKDPDLGRKVAIKVVLGHADGSSGDRHRHRLRREAQAMAQISHPNLATVYEVGQYRGHVFIAMEYVRGCTAREWLEAETRTWSEIVNTFAAAGRGLAAAHAAGIVHRDFKPDNALVGVDGTVKVLDFGLAVGVIADESDLGGLPRRTRNPSLALSLTQTGAVCGTPAYMSPEQHLGDCSDARTDQFSFAVALFEALYGHRPFAGEGLIDLAASVLLGRMESERSLPQHARPVGRPYAASRSRQGRTPALGERRSARPGDGGRRRRDADRSRRARSRRRRRGAARRRGPRSFHSATAFTARSKPLSCPLPWSAQ